MVQGRKDVLVIGIVIFALDRVYGDAVIAHQRSSHVVLRGQRIGGANHHLGPTVAQGNSEVGGLGGHVQAGGNTNALEWLVLDELLADALQHRHRLVGPFNAALAQISKINIFYIMRNLR